MKKDNESFDKLFKGIKVAVIDMDKLSEVLTKEIGKPVNPWGPVCIVTNSKGKVGVFNCECIGTIELEKPENEYPFDFDCYPVLEKGHIAMFPSARCGMSAEEVKKMAADHGKETNLKDFMGDRYSYNGRIESNMWEFKRWYTTGK